MINTQAGGIDWRKEPDRDLYELVYINEPKKKHVHAAFQTFPDRQEFGTGDLFEKHPTKPDLWRLVGRRDDMLVLSTGEKVQPRPMEDMICGHPAVRSAIVFGHGRFQTGAVIELREYPSSGAERSDLMDSVWGYVEKANEQAPAHARLVRELVFFAGPEKPFVRVGKGM
jgi:long-subunit acyl-CoA synthetase (AMP-forming)